MFGKQLNLFKLFGFQVKIDFSWVFIAVLIAWSLSTGLFPFQYQGLSTRTYWIMGIIGSLGLFLSIIIHEFSHSLVARRYGMQMKGITLFIFGGMAEMSDEPPSPKAEFMMAVVGPVTSILLAGVFYVIYIAGATEGQPNPVNGVVQYLAFINALLAAFNVVPAFPLDGGRMLRSVLWGVKGDLRWATRVSARIGSGFGILLIGLGIFNVFAGNFIGGMWWFLIGMFLYSAAKMSYQQLLTRRALEGESVRRFMKSDPITVSPGMTIKQLVEDYVYAFHHKLYPVVDGSGRLDGCITTQQIKEVPREEWDQKRIGDLKNPCSRENTISPDMDAVEALSLMNRTGASRLMVTENGRLVGVVTLKDMLKFLSLRIELDI
ncbi:MAG: site-2 protease family protein [Deltaproteobacteria bacterium]|nr:site-2 protease family protein [Deltaproteobacteria bacterium]